MMSGWERMVNKIIIKNNFPFVFTGDVFAYSIGDRKPDFLHKESLKYPKRVEEMPDEFKFVIEFDSRSFHDQDSDLERDIVYLLNGFRVLAIKENLKYDCVLNGFTLLDIDDNLYLDDNPDFRFSLEKKLPIAINFLLNSKITDEIIEKANFIKEETQRAAFRDFFAVTHEYYKRNEK